MDEDVKMWLWLAGIAVTAIGVVIAVRRKAKQDQWHERPSRTYKPELDELEDVQRREYRRPL